MSYHLLVFVIASVEETAFQLQLDTHLQTSRGNGDIAPQIYQSMKSSYYRR